VKERNIGKQKAVASLLLDKPPRLGNGDIGRPANGVSPVGKFCGREMKREEVPARDHVSAIAIGDDYLAGIANRDIRRTKTDGNRIFACADLHPFVAEWPSNIRHTHLYWHETR